MKTTKPAQKPKGKPAAMPVAEKKGKPGAGNAAKAKSLAKAKPSSPATPTLDAMSHDVSHVRGHAEAMNASIGAKAFTTGQDVVFGAGQYAPGAGSGKELLAHELTHVVQQGGNNP